MKITELLMKVTKHWKSYVKNLSDEELNHDRSAWMASYGRQNKDDEREEDIMLHDIHTLALELEQLRRNKEIYYDHSRLKDMV